MIFCIFQIFVFMVHLVTIAIDQAYIRNLNTILLSLFFFSKIRSSVQKNCSSPGLKSFLCLLLACAAAFTLDLQQGLLIFTAQVSINDSIDLTEGTSIIHIYAYFHYFRMLLEPDKQYALTIDGMSLAYALGDHLDKLREICLKCTAVLCCRMSPLQKAKVSFFVILCSIIGMGMLYPLQPTRQAVSRVFYDIRLACVSGDKIDKFDKCVAVCLCSPVKCLLYQKKKKKT